MRINYIFLFNIKLLHFIGDLFNQLNLNNFGEFREKIKIWENEIFLNRLVNSENF